MLREFLTLVVPLVLPTALYLVWLRAVRQPPHGALVWHALPWVWLAGTGVVLTAVVLFVVTVHFGTPTPGLYVPPHVDEQGRIVPAHIDPTRQP